MRPHADDLPEDYFFMTFGARVPVGTETAILDDFFSRDDGLAGIGKGSEHET